MCEHSHRDSEEAATDALAYSRLPEQESDQGESLLNVASCRDDDRDEQVYVGDDLAADDSEPHGSGSNLS
jgi:hypothetical protein